MLAEPAEGLAFSWYLNWSDGNPNEGRLIQHQRAELAPEASQSDEANKLATDHKDQSSSDRRQTGRDGAKQLQTSSQLNYLVETSADYGRLYCFARNSIGQQKRACVYEIRPPGEH